MIEGQNKTEKVVAPKWIQEFTWVCFAFFLVIILSVAGASAWWLIRKILGI